MLQTAPKTALDGLWVLLVDDAEPVMARGGDENTYLLVFKNVVKARQFVAASALDGVQPRLVVRGNRDDIVRSAKEGGASGLLLDYDPTTQKYAEAASLN